MNKKDIISLVIAIAIIVLLFNFNCNGKSSLEFEEVKFNTPEKVIEELGIKDLPKFSYIGNTAGTDFNWDFWDCLVEFEFEDTLSLHDKENIIKQVAQKDTIHWEYKDLSKEGVAEFYNIKYNNNDTIPYNMVITNNKIYVAYDNNVYYHSMPENLFNSTDYHLLTARNYYIGIDSEHKWIIQLNKSYTQYIDKFKESEGWECKNTSDFICFTKETSQDYHKIHIIKKRTLLLLNMELIDLQ